MTEVFLGGCLCGAVRYRCAAAPIGGGHCHCEDCRRSSGTGHCSHLAVADDAFTLTGQTQSYAKPADSGNLVTRHFCPTCGAPVFSVNSGFHSLVFVRASSLDDLEVFKPTMVVYTRSAASWDHMDPSLPAYPEMAPQNDRPPEVMSAQQG